MPECLADYVLLLRGQNAVLGAIVKQTGKKVVGEGGTKTFVAMAVKRLENKTVIASA